MASFQDKLKHRKGKLFRILMKQEMIGWQWYQLDYRAPCSRQITTSAPPNSIFIGRSLFLSPNQWCQNTKNTFTAKTDNCIHCCVGNIYFLPKAKVFSYNNDNNNPKSHLWCIKLLIFWIIRHLFCFGVYWLQSIYIFLSTHEHNTAIISGKCFLPNTTIAWCIYV